MSTSIDNPVINKRYDVPARHFRFGEYGITDEIVDGRHDSPGPVEEEADTTRNLWVPAVNRHGHWGRWSCIDMVDPSRANVETGAACEALQSARELVS